jgi:hypothetical protein
VNGEPLLTATSTFASASAPLTRWFALNGGYDNRRNVRLYRDRLTPETEFDDRYRQGAWLGGSLELWSHLRLDGDGRTNGGADHARTASGGLEVHRLTRYSVSMNGRFSQFTSDASVSRLVTFRLGGAPVPPLHVQFSGGSRATTDQVSATRETVRWGSADFDLVFARRWFVSASIERDRGGLENLSQGYATLSWRF